MLRRGIAICLFAGALACALFALGMTRAWFELHVAAPSYYLPPGPLLLPLMRGAAVLLALVLLGCAFLTLKHATAGGAARVLLALALALVTAELWLRFVAPDQPQTRLEWRLGVADARTGWAFIPHRTSVLSQLNGPFVQYAIDVHGDRAQSQEFVEDPQAPTLLVAGESIALGHGLEWSDTFAARLGAALRLQVVNVAEGGYSSGQAHLRAVDALARLQHPAVLVETFLPVQLRRNLLDDRPRLELVGGALELQPASRSPLLLRQLLVNDLPVLGEAQLQHSLQLTRAILQATAQAARAKGARPLFVMPCYRPVPPEILDVLRGLPAVVVELDPARIMPWDGHPDREGARLIADAALRALSK